MQVDRRLDGSWHARAEVLGDRLRVVVLCSDDPHHAYLLSCAARRLDVVGAIIEPGSAQQRRLWDKRRWVDAVARSYQIRRQRVTGRSSYRRRYFSPLTSTPQVPAHRVDWINSPEAHRRLVELRPDVTIVCGTTYLRSHMIEDAGLMVNIHGGCLPEYKGNHCVFFAFLRKDYEHIGATLHLVTSRLDGGDIIETVLPEIYPHDNDEHLYDRAVHQAIDRIVDLLAGLEAGAPLLARRQDDRGETFRHRSRKPLLDLQVWARARLGLEQVPHLLGDRRRAPCTANGAVRARMGAAASSAGWRDP